MVKLLKPALLLVGVILACSLMAMGVGRFIPAEKTRQITLANYSHQGEFNYLGYSTSGLFSGESAQPAPVLFPQIIEEMEILFSYSGPKTGDVEIKAILEDNNGGWQKEIPIETSGRSTISFPLDLDEVLELGDTINEQLGNRGGSYLLKVVAEVPTESGPFTAVLEGELDSSTLEWKQDGFNKIERGFPGGDDWSQANFGYRVELKENELFGPITLERKPDVSRVAAVGPDFSLFTDLVESVDIGLSYQFNCDAEIDSLTEEVEVEMVVAEPGRWRQSFTLLQPTKKQGEFTINLPLDIGRLREMADSIDQQLGGKGAKELEITILAQVHTVARTDYGTIDEIFNHRLTGKMGETIEWGAVEKGAEDKGLLSTKEGAITEEILVPNLLPRKLTTSSLIGLGISLPIFCALAVLYWRRRPKLSFLEKELNRNRKKYGELISEISKMPRIRKSEVIIPASSLEALVNISNNSLKPILLKVDRDKHTYCLIDSSVRYQYVSRARRIQEV